MIRKSRRVNFTNMTELDHSTAIFDLIMPDGLVINTAAVYGPSDSDDPKYWVRVWSLLDERNDDARLILGDFNSTLDFARDRANYLNDPYTKVRGLLRQWMHSRIFLDCYDELHPGKESFIWFASKLDLY